MDPLAIGIGDAEEQKAFLRVHKRFLAHYPLLRSVGEKALCRTLAPQPESEVVRLRDRSDDDPERVALEDKIMADRVVFFLGRIAADDFGELLLLSANGR